MNKKYLVAIGLLLLSLGLGSCSTRKAYKNPDLPENIFRVEEISNDTNSIANIPWQRYFSDQDLQNLIKEGINNSFDLQIALSRIQQAEANLGQAKAAFFPNLMLSAQARQDRFSTDDSFLPLHTESYSLGVSSSWEADIWGKLSKQKKGAYAQFQGSQAFKNLVQTSLIANIASTYYTLLAMDEQLRVSNESIDLLKETVGTMIALKESAILNAAAVEQSKALLYATQVSIPDLESQIRKLENALCLILGREPGGIERGDIRHQYLSSDMDYGIPTQLLAKRPDVKQAEYAFRAAFEATGVAQANLYPAVNISGMLGFASKDGVEMFFKPHNIVANLIGGLTQPIFAKKQLTSRVKIAKAQQEEALLNFKKAVLNAGNEVSDALYSYESSMRKNQTRQLQVQASETSVYFTQELLKYGDANYTEVLNAQQNLLQANIGQVNDKLQQLQAAVSLYRALGGGQ
ncbi:channel/filament proteins [Bacteroidales bacterium]|nr:channel/filament proteins [Bacteroidales bacterium]